MSGTKEEAHETTPPSGKVQNNEGVVSGAKQNQVGTVMLFGVPIVSLVMDGKERLCLAQISSTLLKDFSYNEIHNRRVALGINCVQCTPVQLEILRRAGAMPVTSRRCGMITRREAERLCKSFLGDHAPPQLPENFSFPVFHECGFGSKGQFIPSRYNSSRAKCIRCSYCQLFFSPNKFIFHSHRLPESRYVQPDAANFNSWRRHLKLCGEPAEEAVSSNSISDMATAQIVHAWEDVKAMFNGGTRKRLLAASTAPTSSSSHAPRHSSSASHGSGNTNSGRESGKTGSSGAKGQSHSENANSTSNSVNHSREHSRGGNSNQIAKKEAVSAVSANVARPISSASPQPNVIPGAYNHDNANANNFLHPSPQNPLLHVSNPLLSPTSRLDSIWNPGLPGPRQCSLPGSPPFSTLPFHPLSIPWLRRPLFPFSHPFGPTLLNEPGNTSPEKLVNLARQNQSAFKPVSRSVDPLFNWINGNGVGAAAAAGAMALGHSTGITPANTILPEDLSLNSSSATPGATTNGSTGHQCGHNTNLIINGGNTSPPFNLAKQVEIPVGSATGNERNHHHSQRANANNNANTKHQIQILSTQNSESDDEENVDIESTAETEECSSTSSIWVSSTTALGRSGGGATTPTHFLGHNNNNTILNNNNVGFARRKRLAAGTPYYSSGDEDVNDNDSDNQDDNTASSYEQYEELRSSETERSGKRKRLWVNELISTTDEEEEGRQVHSTANSNKSKGESKVHHRSSSSVRVLLNSRE